MWNRQRESKNLRNWFRYKTFYYLWSEGYSTWGERDTIFLCWLLLHRQLSTQPTHGTHGAQIHLFSAGPESQPKYPGPIPIWDFYFDISEWHILSACAWTSALMLHLTNPCAKRKVLSLTKLKGKIYKMKSLGNYITDILKKLYSGFSSFIWNSNVFPQQ